jgi:hypothetical protein
MEIKLLAHSTTNFPENAVLNGVILNEFNFLFVLILSFFTKTIWLVDTAPYFRPADKYLNRLFNWLVRSNRARHFLEMAPELKPVSQYWAAILLYNIREKIEKWEDRYYGIENLESDFPDFRLLARHVTCGHSQKYYYLILLLGTVLQKLEHKKTILWGLPEDAAEMLNWYWEAKLVEPTSPIKLFRFLLNLIQSLVICVYSTCWISRRIKFGKIVVEKYLFAADFIEDESDFRIYKELEPVGPILMVNRFSRGSKKRILDYTRTIKDMPPVSDVSGFPSCLYTDGIVRFSDMVNFFILAWRDNIKLLFNWRHLPTPLYFALATIPHRRVVSRSFFNKFQPQYYWGRDPYNPEHIIRRQEINTIGGCSLGINIGVPSYSIIFPMFRYLSFDRYYVYGAEIFERYYRSRWGKDMKIIPIGAYRVDRETFNKRNLPRTKDIAVYVGVFVFEPKMVRFIRELAREFTDRKILVQIKSIFSDPEISHLGHLGKEFFYRCSQGLDNVEYTELSVYEMFCKYTYAISDPSSIIVEAIQFGAISFSADVSAYQPSNVFRNYPEINVTSAEACARRIRKLEDGEWEYPFSKLNGLVNQSGQYYVDTILSDLNLKVV